MTITGSDAVPGSQPRGTQSGSARTTLLNALGEFALTGRAQTPSTGALIRTLEEFGIGRHAARQAINRCATSGWITGTRHGRESRWKLTGTGRDLLCDGIARVEALGTEFENWDGTWLIVMASVPQHIRAVRDRFYQSLRWNGFGSPVPGVWISAHTGRQPATEAAVQRCGLAASTVAFTGTANGIGLSQADLVARAWDLDHLAQRYQVMVDRFSRLTPQSPAEAMVTLLDLDDELQTVPAWDPQLPSVLAPRWPGRAAATRLLEMRAEWLTPARDHWIQLQS